MNRFITLLLPALALAETTAACVGRCDSPVGLIVDGKPAGEAMMDRMSADLDKILFNTNYTELSAITGTAYPCVNGFANGFPCQNFDLLSFLPHGSLGSKVKQGNDIWGWTDPETQREYAIVCQRDGTAFVDITDPVNPIFKGNLPTKTGSAIWRDAKVYKDHAYIVSEATAHGVQVFDLRLLRQPGSGQTFTETAYFKDTGRCHNVVINEETGLAVCVGSRNVCRGGLYMLDIREPAKPTFAGCYDTDGYTHDAQCVIYRGPDAKYQGREICFGYNEDTVTIVDVTNRRSPVLISRTTYKGYAYTHQGWLTEDQTTILFDDELDEQQNSNKNNGKTTTHIMDVSNLEQPVYVGAHISPVTSIDHNLYILGNKAYTANYCAGLRVVDISDIKNTKEIAYFDVRPEDNKVEFFGAWSSYMYFPSGNIVINSIERGLFVVKPTF